MLNYDLLEKMPKIAFLTSGRSKPGSREASSSSQIIAVRSKQIAASALVFLL